jgi:hypothetical protein
LKDYKLPSELNLDPKQNVFLIVCAFRKLESKLKDAKIDNTIVLGIEDLKKLYGPTLASRPQFILTKEGNS